MTVRDLLRALRFDGLWWRKFAYLGSVYGPEWWKRRSPPWIATIIFCCVGTNRRGAVFNMRRVLGSQGWLRDHWHALRVFAAFAHCMNEALEFFSPRARPLDFEDPADDSIGAALVRGRGVILVTCHFGNWDVAARTLARYGRPLNLVMAREVNDTTAEYVRRERESADVRVLLSDGSVYAPFAILRALRRNEIVALQLDRPLGGPGSRPVEFFGSPALFQAGPLHLARTAGAPVVPVFVVRLAARRYRVVLGTERHVPRSADPEEIDSILTAIVGEFEALVRRHPEQWFQFAPFWQENVLSAGGCAPAKRGSTADRAATGAG